MSSAPRRDALLRLIAFGAISGFAALRWADLDAGRPDGRAVLSPLPVIGAVAAVVWIRGSDGGAEARAPGRARLALIAVGAMLTIVLAWLLAGIPAGMLAPGGWGQLAGGIGSGLSALPDATFPYRGAEEWVPRVLSLAPPLLIGIAGLAAFWPRASQGSPRLLPLVVILATYGVAVTLSPPSSPAVDGLVLLLCLALWIWLPALGGREGPAAAALVVAAGLLAMPVASALNGSKPLLDYTKWDLFSSPPSKAEFFGWNHSYGPLDWPRTGRTLLTVRSDEPHYWRAVTLDRFDGYRWVGTEQPGVSSVNLPLGKTASAGLNPAWIHTVSFEVGDLSGQDVVGAGTILSLRGIDGTTPTGTGVELAPDQLLDKGESYTVRAYAPEPTRARLSATAPALDPALQRFTQIDLPGKAAVARSDSAHDPGIAPVSTSSGEPSVIQVAVPLRGSGRTSPALGRIAASPYRPVLRIARHLAAGQATTYGVVRAIGRHLRRTYAYSETPPDRVYALRAFLFRDRIGYCQQFSGAMALMLRMDGIPARVASGFSPGVAGHGSYVVSDYDAHSWVEVYFRGIGWVPFDPTPGAAPARDRSVNAASTVPAPRSRPLPAIPGGGGAAGVAPTGSSGSGGLTPWLAAPAVLLLLGAGVLALQAHRVRRVRRLDPAALSAAQARELLAAMIRLRGPMPGGEPTLLRIERRLRTDSTASSARYAAGLRTALYGAASPPPQPPGRAERRRVRRELAGGRGGMRRRLEGLLAMPPGGPSRRFLEPRPGRP